MTAKKGTLSKAQREVLEQIRQEQEEKQRKLEAAAIVDNIYVELPVSDYGDGYNTSLSAEGEIGFYECRECYALTSSDVAAIRHGEWHSRMNGALMFINGGGESWPKL